MYAEKRNMARISFWIEGNLSRKFQEFWKTLKEQAKRLPPSNQTQWLDRHIKLLLSGEDQVMNYKKVAAGVLAVGVIGASILGYQEITRKTCKDFDSWHSSQVYYMNHPKEGRDTDNDGIYCESKVRASDREEVEKYRK